MAQKQDSWSGRTGFILATIGSAVGIGSIWKFPYEVGSNGGGGFVLFYLLGIVLVVTPLMLAEFAIGRRGRSDAVSSVANVARAAGSSPLWAVIGVLGAVTGFLVLSFYSVIGGWTISYAVDTARQGLTDLDAATASARFDSLLAAPVSMAAYHALFTAAAAVIVARGIEKGIEAACKVLMPVLIGLICLLAVYSMWEGGAAEALRFLFAFDAKSFTPHAVLDAIGLGFFSIGVGFALMITYAAHAGREIDLVQVSIASIAGDTAVSLLAGLAVFPVVFAHGLDPSSGPGLIFETLPLGFARMPAGAFAAVAFYLLLFAAALASAISMLELVVAPLLRLGLSRALATVVAAAGAWTLGLLTVLSFNVLASWRPAWFLPALKGANWFEALDHLTSNLLLPAGGLAVAVFAGWFVPRALLRDELNLSPLMSDALGVLLRWIVPVTIAIVSAAPVLM